ncbi:MAG: MerC domain-containing protein, partial [Calditrichia bacterium]
MGTFVLKIADRYNLDKLGISASLLCAIHCALVPVILPLMSTVGLGFLWSHEFEFFMIALAFVVGIWALSHGYRYAHRKLLP